MSKIIITTVGTSLFTNYQKKETRELKEFMPNDENYPSIHDNYSDLENKAYSAWDEKNLHQESLTNIIKTEWLKETRTNACAEIASLLKILETENQDIEDNIDIHFLATDTLLSALAASLIKDWLSDFFKSNIKYKFLFELPKLPYNKQIEKPFIVKDLQVNTKEAYNKGFFNLIKAIDYLTKSKKNTYILNITGGYKAIIPVLTILGQLKSIPLKYIYNETELEQTELITIGNLPIQFDWAKVEEIYPLLDDNVLQKLTEQELSEAIKLNLVFSKQINKKWNRTPIGDLFFEYVNNNLPEGKSTLGILMEYKLCEYYSFHNEDRKNTSVIRSIYIKDIENESEKLKGNEVDILFEPITENPIFQSIFNNKHKKGIKPKEFLYIPCEVKPLAYFMFGKGINEVKEQFTEMVKYLLEEWGCPKEFRYFLYTPIPVDRIPTSNWDDAKKIMREFICNIAQNKFAVKFILVPINTYSYSAFLQNPLQNITPIIL